MTKTKFWTAALCLGFMMLAGGQGLWAEKLESQLWSEVRTKMQAEGWVQIAEGVFERRAGTKVEHLGYGREGLAWTIGELRRQLEVVMREYEANPSEDLAEIIDGLSIKIARAQEELKHVPRGLASATAAVTGASCGSICYSATADAYAKTTVQGVGAVAEAKFNNACGYSGETYAYAYATAILNGTTNTYSESDPDSGASIISTATAAVNGGPTCSSSANAYAQSTALGISYTTSDSNGSCPTVVVPNPVPTIAGSTYEYFYGTAPCRTKTWTVSTTGGTSPYSYVWKYNGTVVGSGASYSRSVCKLNASFTLDVGVTDANGLTGQDSHYVVVEYEPAEPTCGQYLCK